MYARILKVINSFFMLFTLVMLILIIILINISSKAKILSNLNPKTLAYSELKKEPNTVIKIYRIYWIRH